MYYTSSDLCSSNTVVAALCDVGIQQLLGTDCVIRTWIRVEINLSFHTADDSIIDAFFSHIIFIFSDDWEIAKEFLLNLHSKTNPLKNTEMDGFSCVIKPCRGSASYGVSKACSLEEAERMFRGLLGKIYFICLFFFSPILLIILIFVLLLIYVEMNYLKKTEFSFIIY